MNADFIKRIARAIAGGSQDELERVAKRMVELEREGGHTKLANEIEHILSSTKRIVPQNNVYPMDTRRPLRELPHSKRHGEALVSIFPQETLEHHMVLPEEIEKRFMRIEREYAARERLSAYGLKPRKTILLHGPPGCGKSLGAKRLAWNTGMPLMKVRFDALVSSYFGESASNLRSVFNSASEQSCVLLLDECDFIARSRTQSKDIGEASRIVNALLQMMDEYDAPGLLVATTNIESSLDEALFRRFDEVLLVPPPGQAEIVKLLQLSLSTIAVDPSIKWEDLAEDLNGQPAALIVKVAHDAAKASVLSGQKYVTKENMHSSICDLRKPSQ